MDDRGRGPKTRQSPGTIGSVYQKICRRLRCAGIDVGPAQGPGSAGESALHPRPRAASVPRCVSTMIRSNDAFVAKGSPAAHELFDSNGHSVGADDEGGAGVIHSGFNDPNSGGILDQDAPTDALLAERLSGGIYINVTPRQTRPARSGRLLFAVPARGAILGIVRS